MAAETSGLGAEAKRIALKGHQEVEIRGSRAGLTIILDANVPAPRLAEVLRAKLAAAGEFFRGAACELTWRPADPGAGAAELAAVLAQYGLVLRETTVEDSRTGAERAPGGAGQGTAANKARAAGLVALPGSEALLHWGVLRSGQFLSHPGHVVVMGHVNPGAVIEAGGHVLVLGRLRGTVRAGWPDNRRAVVVTWDLAGRQVSVAGQQLPPGASPPPGARMVRLYRGKIRLEEWNQNL